MIAAWAGNYDTINRLVQEGVEINPVDNNGGTPLHNSIYNNHFDCTTLLLSLGADVNQCDKKGALPLLIDLISLIFDGMTSGNSPARYAVYQAVEGGDGTILQLLLRSGASIEQHDKVRVRYGLLTLLTSAHFLLSTSRERCLSILRRSKATQSV